jgi:hypothetical protein
METGGGTFTKDLEAVYYPQGYYVSAAGKEVTAPIDAITPDLLEDYVLKNINSNSFFGA